MRFFDLLGATVVEEGNWGDQLIAGIKPVLWYVFAAVGVIASLFAIFLAFNLAKASDEAKRSAAKKRIVNVVGGLFIVLILTVVLVNWDTSGARRVFEYRLSEDSFSINEVATSSKKVYLVKDNEKLSSGAVFEQVTNITNITIDEYGTLKAQTAGYIKVNVYYEKGLTKAKLQKMSESEKKEVRKLYEVTITITTT